MIENTLWMTYFEYLPIELKQAEEEGKNVELYRKEIEEIIQTSGDMSFEEKERKAWEILDRIEKEPIKREFPYQEPNEIEKIEELRNFSINYGHIYDGEQLIDEVMVSIMKAPHTYTKFGVHGLDVVLDVCWANLLKVGKEKELKGSLKIPIIIQLRGFCHLMFQKK